MLKKVICILFLLSSISSAQKPNKQNTPDLLPILIKIKELKDSYDVIESLKNEINLYKGKFIVAGEIKDRDKNGIKIWGVAMPNNEEGISEMGCQPNKTNIYVIQPVESSINYQYYDAENHYFIKRSEGENAFGVKVPIWVYIDERQYQQVLKGQQITKQEIDSLSTVLKNIASTLPMPPSESKKKSKKR